MRHSKRTRVVGSKRAPRTPNPRLGLRLCVFAGTPLRDLKGKSKGIPPFSGVLCRHTHTHTRIHPFGHKPMDPELLP